MALLASLGSLAGNSLAAASQPTGARWVMQNEPHLQHARALVKAALQAAQFPAEFDDAPLGNEKRVLHDTSAGRTHISMMPATPARLELVRQGKLRVIPVPLDRGLLGWRVNFLLDSRADLLAKVNTPQDLRAFSMGQNVGWMDVAIYQASGIPTKEVKVWSNGEFAEQMQAGFLDLFPLGLEESISYFLPHFQAHYPQLTLDRHLLVRYPWFRFVWVSPLAQADALYAALDRGFRRIAANGQFKQVWGEHRQLPPAASWQQRRLIELPNPFYGNELVPAHYRHLLLQPQDS
ncbi:hypothetical protein MASR1M59_29150 [Melaminivora sp.]